MRYNLMKLRDERLALAGMGIAAVVAIVIGLAIPEAEGEPTYIPCPAGCDATELRPGVDCGEGSQWALAYTRQANNVKGDGTGEAVRDMDNWLRWYDGGAPNRFSEADTVLDDLQGNTMLVHDVECTADDAICAVHDARWSPDKSMLMYTVSYGNNLVRPKSAVANTPRTVRPVEFHATRYELWVRDMATGTNHLVEGDARMGFWAGRNDLIGFHSCRAGTYPESAYHGNDFGKQCGLHMYRAEFDRETFSVSAIKDMTPAAKMAMGGFVDHEGDWWYSDFKGYGEIGRGGTPANMFTLNMVRGNGTENMVKLNAHGSPTFLMRDLLPTVDLRHGGVGTSQLRLVRGGAEIAPGTIAVVNYYRSNHLGSLGCPIAFTKLDGPEGMLYNANVEESPFKNYVFGSGQFVPPDMRCLTPYGTDSDNDVRRDKQGRAMGKAGFIQPSGVGYYGFTHCGGSCYEGTKPQQTFEAFTGVGIPTATKECRVAMVPRVTDPFDTSQSIPIGDQTPGYNRFDCVERSAFRKVYGVAEFPRPPADIPTGATTTTLRISDVTDGEIHMTHLGTTNNAHVRLQGNADVDWQSRIRGIRIKGVVPWLRPADRVRQFNAASDVPDWKKQIDTMGVYDSWHVGDFWAHEVPFYNDNGTLRETRWPVFATFACNIMYTLAGIDEDGNELAWDNRHHWAVCGEEVTCNGCHKHSVETWTDPIARWMETDAAMQLMWELNALED